MNNNHNKLLAIIMSFSIITSMFFNNIYAIGDEIEEFKDDMKRSFFAGLTLVAIIVVILGIAILVAWFMRQ
jgi:mannose/fructose/N-acetylgalactosamine-specific phosphotransferase system component IIC